MNESGISALIYMYFPAIRKQTEEVRYDLDVSWERIYRLKADLLRAVNQDQAKIDILAQVTVDWAIKYLPSKFWEQQDWFG